MQAHDDGYKGACKSISKASRRVRQAARYASGGLKHADQKVCEINYTLPRVPCIADDDEWAQILLSTFFRPVDDLVDSDDEAPMSECDRQQYLQDCKTVLSSLIPDKDKECSTLPNAKVKEPEPVPPEYRRVKEPEGHPPDYRRPPQQRRKAPLCPSRYVTT